MSVSLHGRSLLTLLDYTPEEIRYLLDLSHRVKRERRDGERKRRFEGYTIALIFEKRSTRTRCSFETAFGEEGGHPVFLSPADVHLGVKETVEDTARVLGRMFDAIQFRGFSQKTVEILADQSGVPVYNGLTDDFHPTQALADLMTLEENFGGLAGRTLVFVGDGRNNVARSLLVSCAKMGTNVRIVAPRQLFPDEELVSVCRNLATDSGSRILVTDSVEAGLEGADAVYTDVWVSMGEEDKLTDRIEILKPYRVDDRMLGLTGNDRTIFLHCLPAVKGNEVTESVFESRASRVFDQAENRKHTIKAIMLATLLRDVE